MNEQTVNALMLVSQSVILHTAYPLWVMGTGVRGKICTYEQFSAFGLLAAPHHTTRGHHHQNLSPLPVYLSRLIAIMSSIKTSFSLTLWEFLSSILIASELFTSRANI